MKIRSLTTLAILAAFLTVPALAAPASLTVVVMKEALGHNAAGQVVTTLTAPVSISPGDRLVYVLTYKNGSTRPETGVVINNPISAHVEFTGAGEGPAPLVSTDNQTFAPLDQIKAAPAAVEAVRWVLADAVPPGGQVRMTFRALLK